MPDEKLASLLDMVSQSYSFFEDDRQTIERTLDLSSKELSDANEELRRQALRQEQTIKQFRAMLAELLKIYTDKDGSKPRFDVKNLSDVNRFLYEVIATLKETEIQLSEKERQLKEAEQLANFGNWQYYPATRNLSWSSQMYVFFGMDEKEDTPLNGLSYSRRVHPQDWTMVNQGYKKAKEDGRATFEHRIYDKKGKERWLEVYVKVTSDSDFGIKWFGTVVEITEKKRAQAQLAQKIDELQLTTAFLDNIIDQLPTVLFIKDAQSRQYVRINKAAKALYGFNDEEIINKRPEDVFPEKDASFYLNQDDEALKSGEIVYDPKEIVQTNTGKRILNTRKIPIKDRDGQIRYLMSVSDDITQLMELQEYLRRSKENAEAANKAKSAFLSSMSHELRTPLNAIIGFAQILRRDPQIASKQRSYIETMFRSGNHLLSMINDVLDLSKIESGHLEILDERCSLEDLKTDILGMFRLKAEVMNIKYQVSLDKDVPNFFRTDQKRLEQVLINLVGNAFKFTERGSITVQIGVKEEMTRSELVLHFSVSDTGKGIKPEHQKRIFEPFHQIRDGFREGTGLGLAISDRIVHLLGGAIQLESEYGQGSTFYFDLPVKIDEKTSYTRPQSMRRAIGFVGKKPIRILIVDDIFSNRHVARALLEELGFECIEAEHGLDAIAQTEQFMPDLILMDIMMPQLDGIEASKRIRKQNGSKTPPILALSAQGSVEKNYPESDVFDGIILKPFQVEELLSQLEKLLPIQFTYEEEKQEQMPQLTHEESRQNHQWLSTLDQALRDQLLDVVEIQDFENTQKIAQKITQDFPKIAKQAEFLRERAEKNDFVYLLDIAEKLEALHES